MKIKEKVLNQENICGTHINLADPAIMEIEAALGYDFIWVDMEHTRLSFDQIHTHHLAASANGTPMFVRVPVHDLTYTKRVLEMGVEGIIFPMVESYEDALEVLSWTLYPPYGKRGCGPKGAVRYGLDDENAYYGKPHIDKVCRFIQIEQKSAVDDIEKIAKIPYLDGCILGMYDLSGSVGALGDIFSPENLNYVEKTIRVFKENNKTVGVSTFATDQATLQRYHDMGVNMISTGAEYLYILQGAKDTLACIRKVQGE